MAALRPCLATASFDAAAGELLFIADGQPVMRLSPNQGAWLIARAAQALASAKLLPVTAVRSGCASDGEGATPSSPDLT